MTIDARHLRKKVGGGIIADGDELALDETFGRLADIGCKLGCSAGPTIPTGVDTAIEFNTVIWDTDGIVPDPTPPIAGMTIQTAGKYIVTGTVTLAALQAASSHSLWLRVKIDGAVEGVKVAEQNKKEGRTMEINHIFNLNAGQVLSMSFEHNLGNDHTLSSAQGECPRLMIQRVGAYEAAAPEP